MHRVLYAMPLCVYPIVSYLLCKCKCFPRDWCFKRVWISSKTWFTKARDYVNISLKTRNWMYKC